MKDLVISEIIEQKIYLMRNQKVMLDSDLAKLYGVETRTLNQAVKRNRKRFPIDFMFQLKKNEITGLRSQIVTLNQNLTSQNVISSKGYGGRRTLPYVFTEQGVAMLSSVLNNDRAIQVNIQIMRTFIKLRQLLSSHKDLVEKIEKMEKGYDRQFRIVFEIIRELDSSKKENRKQIGFRSKEKNGEN
ncbi:MAG: DNA-binding protein [Candidatus Woykebacteria bacterium RBG_13_40_7b]|uniref:DNA-binding protein n=1 Tax=Candidatus Woykebacteria bacterium RBG_13_40_7b TaxID=1802594 RepID=A0A1G1WAB6_9BACT|nr:MAG: DNA-binding protein [Candidatus Woykebacteria bacterium RBG_13_40_7b]